MPHSIEQRLHLIEGQVRALARMVADQEECRDLLQQVSAVKAALQQVGIRILHEHAKACLLEAAQDEDPARVEALLKTFEQFSRGG